MMERNSFSPSYFYFIPRAPLKEHLSLPVWSVYQTLTNFQNAYNKRCFPSNETIAIDANCSVRSVYRAKKILRDLKLIDWSLNNNQCHYVFFDNELLGTPKKCRQEAYKKLYKKTYDYRPTWQVPTASVAGLVCQIDTSTICNRKDYQHILFNKMLFLSEIHYDEFIKKPEEITMSSDEIFEAEDTEEKLMTLEEFFEAEAEEKKKKEHAKTISELKNQKAIKNDDPFEDLWSLYPKEGHRGKNKASTKTYYQKAIKRTSSKEIRLALLKQLDNRKLKQQKGLFNPAFPHMFRWLRDERWTDDTTQGDMDYEKSTRFNEKPKNIYQRIDATEAEMWRWIEGKPREGDRTF